MSYNKMFLDFSLVDNMLKILKEHDIRYKIHKIDEYKSYALDDIYDVPIRIIETDKVVIVEKFVKYSDCDTNDKKYSEVIRKDYIRKIVSKRNRFIVTIYVEYNVDFEIETRKTIDLTKYIKL